MARHIWSVLCRRGVLDKHTNQVSLIDTLEGIEFTPASEIEVSKWIVIPMDAALVSFVERSNYEKPEATKLRVQVIAPDGTSYKNDAITDVNLTEHNKSRNFTFFTAIPFLPSSCGRYKFVVSLQKENEEWVNVSEIPFDISMGKAN
jgi:hypothetical protein